MTKEKLIALAERIKRRLDQTVSDDELWLGLMHLRVREMILEIVVSPEPTAVLRDLQRRERDRTYEDIVSALNEHPEFGPNLAKDILKAFDAYRQL
jgi:hypothetical protein